MSAAAVNAADTVIYVVDIAQIHQNYYKAKQVEAQLKSAAESSNVELKAMDEKRVKLVTELQEIEKKLQNTALTDTAKQEIAKNEGQPKYAELQTLVNNMQGYKAQAEQKLAQQRREAIMEHRKEIVKVIQKIAEEKKADFVVEKNATYFSKPASDITEDVIAALNASAPKN